PLNGPVADEDRISDPVTVLLHHLESLGQHTLEVAIRASKAPRRNPRKTDDLHDLASREVQLVLDKTRRTPASCGKLGQDVYGSRLTSGAVMVAADSHHGNTRIVLQGGEEVVHVDDSLGRGARVDKEIARRHG